jgi:glutamate formiminotransferase/formiminotetrahydrofolate cyclodeaminase
VLDPLVECVPNFSEGRRPEVIEQIVNAIRAVPGATLLDYSSDADHNRTVVTFVGAPDVVEQAAFDAIATAARLINLDEHSGEHPRLGATDVVPFVPLRGVTLDDCVAIAQRLGERVGSALDIPVFLYEAAATRPDRENLAKVRKGEYEALKDAIGTDPNRAPDFGPQRVGPAGATIIGARSFLVAFNVYLNTDNVEIASKIARVIRHSGGGLRFVKAMGLLVDGQAQVSMNLTNYQKTPIYRVVEMIRREAARYGALITHSELVGLIPQEALIDTAQWHLQLDLFEPDQVLETRLAKAQAAEAVDLTLKPDAFINAVAANTAAPGGGAVAAAAGALAAGLAEMVAGLTVGRKKYAEVSDQMAVLLPRAEALREQLLAAIREDVAAFEAVMTAYKLPKDAAGRSDAIQTAMAGAADVPLAVARAALDALKLAGEAASLGNTNATTDAMAGIHMARAAVEVAALNVRINVSSLKDEAQAAEYAGAIEAVVTEARQVGDDLLAQAAVRVGLD